MATANPNNNQAVVNALGKAAVKHIAVFRCCRCGLRESAPGLENWIFIFQGTADRQIRATMQRNIAAWSALFNVTSVCLDCARVEKHCTRAMGGCRQARRQAARSYTALAAGR